MFFHKALVGLLVTTQLAQVASADVKPHVAKSFYKDVVRRTKQKALMDQGLNDLLLSKAVPLQELEKHLENNQISVGRRLEDLQVDYENMYSFNGYSLKYLKCQPIQFFSEEAVMNGEYTPMVTQDIVVMRLCPQQTCSESSTLGCYYNFADYALTLEEYMNIMLTYSKKMQEYTCEWCDNCFEMVRYNNNWNNNYNYNNNNNNNNRRLDDNAGQDDYVQQNEDQNQAAEEEAEKDEGYIYSEECEDYCYNYNTICADQNQNQNNNNNNNYNYNYNDDEDNDGDDDYAYVDYEQYMEYLECSEVRFNGYSYYVKPTCDSSSNTINFGVYWDQYCSRDASGDVDIESLGLGFSTEIFEDYSSTKCIDCYDEVSWPNLYFSVVSFSLYQGRDSNIFSFVVQQDGPSSDVNTMLCNKIHDTSAKCTSDLMYDLFEEEDESDESAECTFIETIRYGEYDENGAFTATSGSSTGSSWNAEVSVPQKAILGATVGVCIIFIIYACYLHHAMTNLLIKSLSHRELLPPTRHPASRRGSKGRSVRSINGKPRSNEKLLGGESDWDDQHEIA